MQLSTGHQQLVVRRLGHKDRVGPGAQVRKENRGTVRAGSTPLGARFFVKRASGKSSPGQAEAQKLLRELWLGLHVGAEVY